MDSEGLKSIAPTILVSLFALRAWLNWGALHEPRDLPAAEDCRNGFVLDEILICDPANLGAKIPTERINRFPYAVEAGDRFRWDPDTRIYQRSRMDPEELAALGVVLDLNRASVEDLTSLPGIGPALAKRIQQARPFSSLEQLEEVRGIGPVVFSRIRSRLRLGRSVSQMRLSS